MTIFKEIAFFMITNLATQAELLVPLPTKLAFEALAFDV